MHRAFAILSALLPLPALAGPPYETDDPRPADHGHWEIHAFATRDGAEGDFGGGYGVDLNDGPVPVLTHGVA